MFSLLGLWGWVGGGGEGARVVIYVKAYMYLISASVVGALMLRVESAPVVPEHPVRGQAEGGPEQGICDQGGD